LRIFLTGDAYAPYAPRWLRHWFPTTAPSALTFTQSENDRLEWVLRAYDGSGGVREAAN